MLKRCLVLFVVFLSVGFVFVFAGGGTHTASEVTSGTFGSQSKYEIGTNANDLKLTMFDNISKVTVLGTMEQPAGKAVEGYASTETGSSGIGVYGVHAGSGVGVKGFSSSGYGIQGESTSNIGIVGISGSSAGVYGGTTSGYSGYFEGGEFIVASGNVGIGTDTPNSSLHIEGNSGDSDDSLLLTLADNGEASLRIFSASSIERLNPLITTSRSRGTINSPSAISNGDTLFEIWAMGYTGSSFQPSGQITIRADGNPSGGTVPGYISFATSPSGGVVPQRRMIIRSDGKVGIGTETPSQLLEVSGYVKGTGFCIGSDCRTSWSSGDITGVTASTGLSGGGTSGTVSVSIDSSYTQRRVSSSCASGSSIRVIGSDGSVTCETDDSGLGAESDPQVGSVTSNYVPKWTGSSLNTGTIYDNGNIGIGTTAPSEKLHVSGAIRSDKMRIATSNGPSYDSLYSRVPLIAGNGWYGSPDAWVRAGGPGTPTGLSYGVVGIGDTAGVSGYTGDMWANAQGYLGYEAGVGMVGVYGSGSTWAGYFNGRVKVTGALEVDKLGTSGKSATSGYPSGWGGGVHAWDVYAEGTVGAGPANGPARAYINNAGQVVGVSKNFVIDHPSKEGYKLVHGTLEGPESAVFYRGESELVDGRVTIFLPDYFEDLTRVEGRSVVLTPKLEAGKMISNIAASEVRGGRFEVASDGNPSQKFYWLVIAVRKDIQPLVVEQKE